MTSRRRTAAIIVAILAAVAAAELWMGRVPVCTCGRVTLWHGLVHSPENSQQITDWYTFTHVLHGILFYAVLWLAGRRVSVAGRLTMAVALEGAWEVLENSPLIIDRYRAATIAYDYYGDSVVNSVSDVLAMMLGFWLARRLPVRITVGLAVATEVALALIIRDNLTLNIVMLLRPIAAIKHWQAGG